MQNVLKKLFLIFIIFIVISCSSNKNFAGIYKSNYADLGFFSTTIIFMKDSTFAYKFSGDLINQELTGEYKIRNRNVYLKFYKNKGEIESKNDSLSIVEILLGNYHSYDVKKENGIVFHLKFKYENHKLYSYRIDTGKLVTHTKRYSGKWKSRKSYLKKI